MKRISHRSRQCSFAFHIYIIFCGFDLHHLVFMSVSDSWSTLLFVRSLPHTHKIPSKISCDLYIINLFMSVEAEFYDGKLFRNINTQLMHASITKYLKLDVINTSTKCQHTEWKKTRRFSSIYKESITKSMLFRNHPHFQSLNTITD